MVLPSDVDSVMITPWDATPPSQAPPDLFSTNTVRPPRPTSAVKTPTLPHRYVLPKNLGAAVKQLSDGELEHLFKAAFDEAKRRGRLPRTVATNSTSSFRRPPDFPTKRSTTDKSKRRHMDIADVALTRGQVNAVRSALKASADRNACG